MTQISARTLFTRASVAALSLVLMLGAVPAHAAPLPVPSLGTTVTVANATATAGTPVNLSATLMEHVTIFGHTYPVPVLVQPLSFTVDATNLGSANTNGIGSATKSAVDTSGMTVGTHPITVNYAGFNLHLGDLHLPITLPAPIAAITIHIPAASGTGTLTITAPSDLYVDSAADAGTANGTQAHPYKTIQAAIDAAITPGSTIYVRAGSYSETATNRTISEIGGTYQFGLFIGNDRAGLTIKGTDASWNPITSAGLVDVHVTTNATNDFGPSGVFVEGDNVTLQGLDIGANTGGLNKSVEVIGDNFTFVDGVLSDPDGGDIYLNDFTGAGTKLSSYHITDSIFENGATLDIASGAGATGAVSTRTVTGNTFNGAGATWALISFDGAGGQPWYTYPVGAATITGNTFSGGTEYIRTRGTVVSDTDFNWSSYWNDNTFDASVIDLADVPSFAPRAYTYTNGVTFTNVRDIGASIQNALGSNVTPRAVAGDTVMVGKGTYTGDVSIPVANLTLTGAGADLSTINLAGGYGINLDNNVSVPGFTMSGFTVNASPTTSYAFKAHKVDGLMLSDSVFNGGAGNTGGGVDINTTSNVSISNVTSTGFHKNGFAVTSKYDAEDTAGNNITFNNIIASHNGWTGISFYTSNSSGSVASSITGVHFTGTNILTENGAGIHLEGDSDAHETAAATPAYTITTDGTTLDLSTVSMSGNSFDVVNYQTAPVNALATLFESKTGTAMTAGERTTEDGKISDQLDHSAYGLVTYYIKAPGSIAITTYICPDGTSVVRSANGVGGTVPAGCVAESGVHFGYVHGTQTDANAPYPELAGPFTLAGATDGSGVLTIPSLPSTGRYLVAKTDNAGAQLPADQVLGLYCVGDGDTSNNNDNQELTFVPEGGSIQCVAYDQGAPAAPTLLGWNVQSQAAGLESDPISLACTESGVTVTDATNSLNQRWTTVGGTNIKYIRRVSADNAATWNTLSSMVFAGPSMNGWFSFGSGEQGTYDTEVMAFDDLNNNGIADDGVNTASGWSNDCKVTFTHQIADVTGPSVPVLTSPTSGSTVNTNDFYFNWNPSTDDSAGPLTYESHFTQNPAQAGGILTDPGIWASTTPTNTIHSQGAPDGTWYWQVRAEDPSGNFSGWSDIWNVIIDTVTQGGGDEPDTTAPTATITFPTPGPSATSFTVTYSEAVTATEASDPANYFLNNWPGAGGSGPLTGNATVAYDASSHVATVTFTNPAWYVSAEQQWGVQNVHDLAGNVISPNPTSAYSSPLVSPLAPGIPTVSGSGMPQTWTWDAAVDPGGADASGIASYEYELSGNTSTSWINIGNVTSFVTNLGPGNYQFHVRALDKAGNPAGPESVSTNLNIGGSDEDPGDGGDESTSVITNEATNVTSSDATLNGHNSTSPATEESFWVSLTDGFDISSPNIPANVYSTPVLGGVGASAAFSTPLSMVAEHGIITGGASGNLAITPDTTYYFVAWADDGVTGWHPGVIKSLHTLPVTDTHECATGTHWDGESCVENPSEDTGHAPVATAGTVTTAENTAVAVTLAGTDEDEGDTLTFATTSSPANGILSGDLPNLTYTPNANFSGTDSFTFTATDGTHTSEAATVTITVTEQHHSAAVVITGSNNGGGSSGGSDTNGLTPQVKGESTTTEETLPEGCVPLLTSFLKFGAHNDADQVKKLQTFLNGEMGSNLPVTGFFGTLTRSAVKSFQEKYWEDILKPWAPLGFTDVHVGNGFVFKSTEWKINVLNCSTLDAPFPTLP